MKLSSTSLLAATLIAGSSAMAEEKPASPLETLHSRQEECRGLYNSGKTEDAVVCQIRSRLAAAIVAQAREEIGKIFGILNLTELGMTITLGPTNEESAAHVAHGNELIQFLAGAMDRTPGKPVSMPPPFPAIDWEAGVRRCEDTRKHALQALDEIARMPDDVEKIDGVKGSRLGQLSEWHDLKTGVAQRVAKRLAEISAFQCSLPRSGTRGK